MTAFSHTEISKDAAAVELRGPLNSTTSPQFDEYVSDLINKKFRFLLIDAAKLEYVSSEGIGLLLFIHDKLKKKNGYFVLYNVPPEIESLYAALGFTRVFTLARDRESAMDALAHAGETLRV